MIITDINYSPIEINDIEVTNSTQEFWVLNLVMRDFTISPLVTFEEITCKSAYILEINETIIQIPDYWNILIYSEETSQLDIVDIETFTTKNFKPVVFNFKKNRIDEVYYKVIDNIKNIKIQTVTIPKTCMLCHPIDIDKWICLSPNDNYNKYIKDGLLGDLY